MNKQVVLVILDGWGYRKEKKHNAIAAAKKPNFDYLWGNYPHTILQASGEAIGLPAGQIGTSEANHLIIGSGRILFQNLLKINHAIKTNQLKNNPAIISAFKHVIKHDSVLHIKGMASPGGVHSHTDHIKYLIKSAKDYGVKSIMLHLFTDGRDVLPKSAINYIHDLEKFMQSLGVGKIASIGGRYWGMDRDNNPERIEKHFKVLVVGDGPRFKSAIEVIESAYKKGITDEYIEPALIETHQGEIGCIQSNDAVIFANFRADRAKQITRRFIKAEIKNLKYVGMIKYADDIDIEVAFPKDNTSNTLSDVLNAKNISQLRITETEKFTHLTFFFNAQQDKAASLEERIMIPSNKDVATHDLKPEMKALEIVQECVKDLINKKHNFIALNITNADMVGHSGNVVAIIKAIEIVDKAVGMIITAAKKVNADVIITADHGNAEENYDEINHQPMTAHTLNPVPFILISSDYKKIKRQKGMLSDIAPTVLKLFGIKKPIEMTGESFV